MVHVKKRNGNIVDFDSGRIVKAISKAYKEVYNIDCIPVYAEKIADEIEEIGRDPEIGRPLTVEEIQDLVEDYLFEYDSLVSKAYIKYRYKRGVMRSCSTEFIQAISEKLSASNVVNQNANVDEHSFGGRLGEASGVLTKQYAIDFMLSPMAKENHLGNMIYIHDLDHYALGDHNCLSIPFDKLLAEGFNTRQTDVRPANSINTACQLVAVLFQLQSLMQFGGVSATHLDWTLVPYIRKSFRKHWHDGVKYIGSRLDHFPTNWIKVTEELPIDQYPDYDDCAPVYNYALEMTHRELKQAIEGLYHNLNTLQSRSGNQLPFTSINYGTCTSTEGRMAIKAIIDGSIAGVGKYGKTPIFPCGIFQCKLGTNRHPGDPNYDLFRYALASTARRIYPNYANVDWSGNAGYDPDDPKTYFSTMGKRKLQLM